MIARIGFRLTRALLIGCAKGAAFARRVLVEDAGVNDMLPRLELSHIPIADLRPSARKLRKLDPVHVRDVASAISALVLLCHKHLR